MTAPHEITTGDDRSDARGDIEPGSELAKYRLRRIVGAGGMGVVWAAYDPDLDREVAIKVLHGNDAHATTRTRLLREARAMARLKHPNVVTVFEVGTERNRDYVVMELIDGQSLEQWLATRPPRTQILDALLAAGRGLAAAHAADLVHRDFKPHNVLRAEDGRVLVTDFGLARERLATIEDAVRLEDSATPALDETIEARRRGTRPVGVDPVLGSPLTGTGALIGTPAYMAAELLAGGPSDANTDQFAFCVTAWQALTGTRPFGGNDLTELHAAVLAGPSRIKAKLPRGVRAILERGLDPDPKRRWPDLGALLTALDRTRRKRTQVAIAAGCFVAAAAIAAYLMIPGRDDTCSGAERAFTAVWNDSAKSTARAAFLATKLPYAAFAWNQSETVIDRYGRAWIAMHTETCKATHVLKEQSEPALDLRMSCLAQRLREVKATAEQWAHADQGTVTAAARVAAAVSPLEGCADLVALAAVTPPPETKAKVADVRDQLARVNVQANSGRRADALLGARSALDLARATGYEPVIAEALLQLGLLQQDSERDAAEKTMNDAFLAAEASEHHHVATVASSELAAFIGLELIRQSDGAWWSRIARAVARRRSTEARDRALAAFVEGQLLGNEGKYDAALVSLKESLAIREQANDEPGVAQSHIAIGQMLRFAGKHDSALVELRRALEIDERLFGPVHPAVGDALYQQSQALAQHGDLKEALAPARRALAIYEGALGADNPRAADCRFVIGNILSSQGDFEGALVEHRRALEIHEKSKGADHVSVANAHQAIGTIHLKMHKFDEALVELRTALAIKLKTLPADHPDVARSHMSIGNTLGALGKSDEALSELRIALAIGIKAFGPGHPFVASGRTKIGDVLANEGLYAEALVELEAALASKLESLGAGHPDTANALASVGEVYLALHRYREAADALERALAVIEAKAPDAATLGELRFGLAKALWGEHHELSRAVDLARKARDDYASDAGNEKELRDVDGWLAGKRL